MNRWKLVAGFAALVLLVTACGVDDAEQADAPGEDQVENGQPTQDEVADELHPLTVASGGVCICHAPLYVGIEEGIFEEHGLDVTIREVPSGFEGLGALATGEVQVADAVVAVAAQAQAEGADSVAVLMANGDPTGTIDTSGYFAIVAHPDSGAEAGDLSSLVGMTIGLPTQTIAHQYLHFTLLDNGIDPENDVELQHVSPPDLPSAIQAGSVDAIAAWEPLPLRVLETLEGAVEVTRGGDAIDYLFQRWMSPEFVQENPAVARSFVEAFVASMQFARQDPVRTGEIMEQWMEGISRDIIDQALEELNFDPRISQATVEAAQQGLDFASDVDALDPSVEYSVEEQFMVELVQELEQERPEYFDDLPEIPADLQL